MSTYLTPAAWVSLKTYKFKSLSRKDNAIQAAFEQTRSQDSDDTKSASEVVFKLGICVRKIQSIVRGFVARRRVLWLKSSLEECARDSARFSTTSKMEKTLSQCVLKDGYLNGS